LKDEHISEEVKISREDVLERIEDVEI